MGHNRKNILSRVDPRLDTARVNMDVTISSLIVLCILVSASGLISNDQSHVESLTNCVAKMLQAVEHKKYDKWLDVTVMNINNDLQLSAVHKMKRVRFISRRFFWNTGNINNMIYIVMSEDYKELANGLNKVTHDKFWNPSARFIIIVENMKEYSLHNVTDLLHTYNIFRKVSVISRDGDEYAIYKYNLSKPGYCLKAGHLKFWLRCSDYCSGKMLPPLNTGTVKGCRYKLVAQNLWPFTNFDSSIKGTEQYIIDLFQKHYEIKIDIQEFTKVNKYGIPVGDQKQIMLKKVESNEVEGVVGGYDIKDAYSGNTSHSYPMTIDHMFYILARSDFVDQWAAVLNQFFTTFIVIGIIFIIFCVAATCLSIFNTRKDITGNVLIVFGYILNKNFVKRTPSGWARTLIFSSLLLTGFIIPYTIQANLYSVTTRPVRAYEPEDLKDLKDYRAFLYTEWHYKHEFNQYSDCGTRLNCLLRVKNCQNKSIFTIVSGAHFLVHQWRLTDHHCQMIMYHLKEPYVSIFRAVYFRRGSALLDPFNDFVLQLVSTGIIKKYSSGIYHRSQLKCKPVHRPDHVPLTLRNISNVFLLLLGGYCLSLLTFIFEVYMGSQNNSKINT